MFWLCWFDSQNVVSPLSHLHLICFGCIQWGGGGGAGKDADQFDGDNKVCMYVDVTLTVYGEIDIGPQRQRKGNPDDHGAFDTKPETCEWICNEWLFEMQSNPIRSGNLWCAIVYMYMNL